MRRSRVLRRLFLVLPLSTLNMISSASRYPGQTFPNFRQRLHLGRVRSHYEPLFFHSKIEFLSQVVISHLDSSEATSMAISTGSADVGHVCVRLVLSKMRFPNTAVNRRRYKGPRVRLPGGRRELRFIITKHCLGLCVISISAMSQIIFQKRIIKHAHKNMNDFLPTAPWWYSRW